VRIGTCALQSCLADDVLDDCGRFAEGGQFRAVVVGYQCIAHAAGARAAFKVKSGTSDMNVVGPVWSCPIVAYGPGDSTLDHTPGEHIDLDEYHRSIAVLIQVLQQLQDEPSPTVP